MNHVVSQVGLCTTQTLHDKAENHEMLQWVLTICCMIFNLGPYCILLTILNKSGSLELYLSGVWSEVFDMNFACRVTDPFLYKMWCATKQTLIVQKVIDTHTRKPMSLSIHLIHPFSGTILVFDVKKRVVHAPTQPSQDVLRGGAAEEEQEIARLVSSTTLPHQNSQPGERGWQMARSKVLSRRTRNTWSVMWWTPGPTCFGINKISHGGLWLTSLDGRFHPSSGSCRGSCRH